MPLSIDENTRLQKKLVNRIMLNDFTDMTADQMADAILNEIGPAMNILLQRDSRSWAVIARLQELLPELERHAVGAGGIIHADKVRQWIRKVRVILIPYLPITTGVEDLLAASKAAQLALMDAKDTYGFACNMEINLLESAIQKFNRAREV